MQTNESTVCAPWWRAPRHRYSTANAFTCSRRGHERSADRDAFAAQGSRMHMGQRNGASAVRLFPTWVRRREEPFLMKLRGKGAETLRAMGIPL